MIRATIAAGHWLAPGAAASYARMRAAGMPGGGITEAGRTGERQADLYRQFLAGLLPATAARPGQSLHERGTAMDMVTSSPAHAWMCEHGAEHGWSRPLLHARQPEPWHHQYDEDDDQHRHDPPPTAAPAPPREDTDMHLCHIVTPWGEHLWAFTTASGGANVIDANRYQHLAEVWPTRDVSFAAWQTEAREAWVRAGLDDDAAAAKVADMLAPLLPDRKD